MVIIITAALADIGTLVGTLTIERDWVVVLAAGDSEVLADGALLLPLFSAAVVVLCLCGNMSLYWIFFWFSHVW